jgi:hypothetical protein
MVLSLIVFSQQANNDLESETINLLTNSSSANIQPSHFNSSSVTPIWSEDFSAGFPALWSTSSSNMGGAFATCPWAWTTDGTWGYYNGNQGTAGSNALTSTTASNGFLICDTDSANHYANGQPSGSTYQYIESLVTTNAIDLSIHPAVSLEFEHLFRYNNLGNGSFTPPTVYVSTDSINWTSYLVNGGISNNTQSSNPVVTSVNISSVAGNQSSVYIRFGWVARCYYWMIDDIKIVETEPNKLEISDHTYGGWWLGYQALGDYGIDYTFNPLNQINSNPYRMEAVVKNNGANLQTNTKLNTIVTDELGNVVMNAASNPISSQVNALDTLATNSNFSPTSYGYHNISFFASSDSFPSSDTLVRGTVVSDTVYAVDYDWNSDGTNAGNGYFLGRSCGGQVLANAFDIYENTTITSISFHVTDNSVPGAELSVELYETDGQIFLEESDTYVLTAADIDSWVTLPLLNPYPLFAGTSYMAAVKGTQHPLDTSLISSTENPNTVKYLQDNGCNSGSLGFGGWYTISKALLIRMNFGTVNSINEEFKLNYNVYPNPSNGKFTIDNLTNDTYDLKVNNIFGQQVLIEKQIKNVNKEIDLSLFSSGIYIVEIKNKNNNFTHKLLLE